MAEFLAKSQSIRDAMENAVLKDAATAGAKVILDLARGFAPVAEFGRESEAKWGARRPGQLRDSLTMSVRPRPGRVSAAVGPGPEGFYGRFLEFGTVKMAARPFMRPAFDAGSEDAIEQMKIRMASFLESQGT